MQKILTNTFKKIITKRGIYILVSLSLLFFQAASQSSPQTSDWQKILKEARGQTVYFHAWGKLPVINEYIEWAGKRIKELYGVNLRHIKTTDIALTVKQIITESKTQNKGSADLLWINGENFKTLKKAGLLSPKLDEIVPGAKKIDFRNNASARQDFSEPVDGYEIPWGTARFVFIYDSKKITHPPQNKEELLDFVKNHKQRFTYPAPPEFHGTTFLKQILYESISPQDHGTLYEPASPESAARILPPLWKYLDTLHPYLWRGGKNFPRSLANLTQLFRDSEILLSMSFNPNFSENQICLEEFPPTVKSYSPAQGGIGNTHFLAVPANSESQPGAYVVIDFLVSAEAQAKKLDRCSWGDPTVLDIDGLSSQEKKFFTDLPQGIENFKKSQANPPKTLLEPHSSWTEIIEKGWINRYGH